MHDTSAGIVLVRRATDPARDPGWSPCQAGRHHLAGVHWKARRWPRRNFVAFRDHVARHVEIKPSRLELREGRHAIAMTLIEDTRQEQAQLDPDSQKYADPE